MNEPIDFYGGPFSNFAYSPITVDVGFGEHEYATVEHAFQAAKATTEWQHHAVRACGTPGFAKQAGRQVTLRPDWEEVKYDIMVKCLREKFKIKMFKRELLSTGHRELREDSPTDFEWGARNSGKNLLGKALMQIRQELHDSQ
jgi:N-glycosidase YbiA